MGKVRGAEVASGLLRLGTIFGLLSRPTLGTPGEVLEPFVLLVNDQNVSLWTKYQAQM